jgi:hypothetical protein
MTQRSFSAAVSSSVREAVALSLVAVATEDGAAGHVLDELVIGQVQLERARSAQRTHVLDPRRGRSRQG